MNIRHYLVVLTILLCCPHFALAEEAPGVQDELSAKMTELAKRVLSSIGQKQVTVGAFTDSGEGSNFGPGMEALLREALNREGKREVVAAQAPYVVKGDYSFTKLRDRPDLADQKVVKVTARLIEREFDEAVDEVPFSVLIEQNSNIAQILQVSGELDRFQDDVPVSPQQQNSQIDQLLTNPEVHLHGANNALASSSIDSPYSVEIWVRNRPMPLRLVDNQAFVDLQRGDVYQIVLHNSDFLATGAHVTIDGINVFHFCAPEFRKSTGEPTLKNYIIPASKIDSRGTTLPSSAAIIGWFVKKEAPGNFFEFRIGEYGQGVASQAGLSARGKTGVIHVAFARPQAETFASRGVPVSSTRLETERGEKIDVEGVEVQSVRFEPPHDFVAIRYSR